LQRLVLGVHYVAGQRARFALRTPLLEFQGSGCRASRQSGIGQQDRTYGNQLFHKHLPFVCKN
jgi:hypothetical protein